VTRAEARETNAYQLRQVAGGLFVGVTPDDETVARDELRERGEEES
jgi:hypothetical protein